MIGQRLRAPERSEIKTSDPEAVQSFLSAAYGTKVKVSFPDDADGSDRERYSHARTAVVGLFAAEMIDQRGVVHASAERLDPAIVYLPESGRVECHMHACSATAGPGEILLAQCSDGLLSTHLVDVRSTTVVLDQSLLIDAAAAEALDSIRFTAHHPVSAAAAQTFRYAVDFIRDTVLTDDEKATPLVLGAAGRLLASAALTAFHNTTISAASARDSLSDGSPAALRRAVDFIHDNAHRDIGVTEIAAHVYLTARAVQYMFRRFLDVTPSEYLRMIRIEHARNDLLSADRSTTTVAATAARWGFAHTGRFAVSYRQAYGESPHETLRR